MKKNSKKIQNQNILKKSKDIQKPNSNFLMSSENKQLTNYSCNSKQLMEEQTKKTVFQSNIDPLLDPEISILNKFTKKLKMLIKDNNYLSGCNIIKTRKFQLNLEPFVKISIEEKQKITNFPEEYKNLLDTGKNLCHNDMNFCYELLKPLKKSYYIFFKDNGFVLPNITEETADFPTISYKFLQNYVHEYLLQSFYSKDGRFRQLFTDVLEYFKSESDNPLKIGKFKGTNKIHIKKTFISGNKILMDFLSHNEENCKNNWQITYETKNIVINSIYYAFRDRSIKNFWFLLLSYYFSYNKLVSKEEFTKFLLNEEINYRFAEKLYNQLLYDVNGILRGWKGNIPTWRQFINELRFFRKQLSNILSDSEFHEFFTENQYRSKEFSKDIINKFLEEIVKETKSKSHVNFLSEFFASKFVTYLNKNCNYQFKRMFKRYYSGKTNI